MPVLEATEYERFSFHEADRHTFTLDEAVRKAKELRKNDATNFYRIEVADEEQTTFVVTKVPQASVYADFMARMAKLVGRCAVHARNK